MNQSRSEIRNTWQRARARLRSGLLMTVVAIAWPSVGASQPQPLPQGVLKGDWIQKPGKNARVLISDTEIRLFARALNDKAPPPSNESYEAEDGTIFYLVWAAQFSYADAGASIVINPSTVTPAQASRDAICQAVVGQKPRCGFENKYTLMGADSPKGSGSYPVVFMNNMTLALERVIGVEGGTKNVDLIRGRKIFSANRRYYFEWQQQDGNLVVRRAADNGYVWGLNQVRKDHMYIKILRLQPDGNFVARGGEGEGDFMWSPLNDKKRNPPQRPTALKLTDDGKLQLTNGSDVLWSVP